MMICVSPEQKDPLKLRLNGAPAEF
jgi:hypothetical protein